MLFRWRMQLAQLTLYLLQLHLRCSLRELATMVPMVLLLSVPCTHVWKMPSTRQAQAGQADGFVALILCMIAGEKCGRKVKCSELTGDGAHAFWQILARLMRHSGSNSREAINTEWHERSWKSLWPDMFMWERIHITWVRKITFKQIPAEQYLIVRMLGQLPFVAEMEIVTVDDLLEIPGIGKAAFGQYGEAIGLSFIVQMVLMFVFFLVVRRVLPHEPDQVSLADVLFSMVFFPILAFAAVWASLELRHSVESRWQGTCFWSDLYLVLYVSRMLCHVLIQPFENMSLALLLMMTFHHLVSMGCYILGLGLGRCHYWGCLDGCCEITTVFLNVFSLLNTAVEGKKLKEYLPAWVAAANGFALWLAFLFFRLMLFPYWLYGFHMDMRQEPEKTKGIVTNLERSIYPATTIVLLVLSCTWFVALTRGMVKSMSKAFKEGKVEMKKKMSKMSWAAHSIFASLSSASRTAISITPLELVLQSAGVWIRRAFWTSQVLSQNLKESRLYYKGLCSILTQNILDNLTPSPKKPKQIIAHDLKKAQNTSRKVLKDL